MPPFAPFLLSARALLPGLPSQELRSQFQHPKEVFSVLLILGGDVVERALAQLAGGTLAPVAFSFGWVGYGVSAVVSAVGENKLMPQPDISCVVINGKNGYSRSNTSWVIGRLVRDYESWMNIAIRNKVGDMIADKWDVEIKREQDRAAASGTAPKPIPRPKVASLCVSIYKATAAAGSPKIDGAYKSGLGTTIVQLGVASIPCGLYGDWGILMITAFGILLSFLTGSLSQWADEKWAGRTESHKKIILTRGNGAQHAIVILGNDVGLDLEDLAAVGNNTVNSASRTTRFIIIVLAGLWILLLITAAGLDQNNWFLLLIGAGGILQNILAAGAQRDPSAMGIPLTYVEVMGEKSVMTTLHEVERKYAGVGYSMLDTFFPGGNLETGEKEEWHRLNQDYFPQSQDIAVAVEKYWRAETAKQRAAIPQAGS